MGTTKKIFLSRTIHALDINLSAIHYTQNMSEQKRGTEIDPDQREESVRERERSEKKERK